MTVLYNGYVNTIRRCLPTLAACLHVDLIIHLIDRVDWFVCCSTYPRKIKVRAGCTYSDSMDNFEPKMNDFVFF